MRVLAFAAVGFAVLGWIGNFTVSKFPSLRTTMWPVIALMALAFVCGLIVLLKAPAEHLPRRLAWGGLIPAVVWALVFIFIHRLPPPSGRLAAGQALPVVTMTLEDGSAFSTDQQKDKGPLVLVFFRGFW